MRASPSCLPARAPASGVGGPASAEDRKRAHPSPSAARLKFAHFGCVLRADARQLLEGTRHPAERGPEIRKIDESQQQSRNPEDVHVREEGQQTEHCDDLELQLMALVGHALRQRMQAQEENTDRQHRNDQEDGQTAIRTSVSPGAAMKPGT